MNNIALISPAPIKDSLGWFHPVDSISRKKASSSSRRSDMSNLWMVNNGGQYIDSDAVVDPSTMATPSASWGKEDDGNSRNNISLSDDLARLKISNDSHADAQVESIRLPRHPSKPTPSSVALAQIAPESINPTTGSPLNSSSSNSSSPHTPAISQLHHQVSHSRGASVDTPNHTLAFPQSYIINQHPHQPTPSSGNNSNGNPLLTHHQNALKTSSTPTTESSKGRPHSFSGGISAEDLRRLSQGGTATSPIVGVDDHDQSSWVQEQLSYPSLSTQQQRSFHNFNYPAPSDSNTTSTTDDDAQYNRSFSSVPPQSHPHQLPSPRAQFVPISNAARMPMNYRRNYTPQGPSPLGYGHHPTHHSLGNTQQLYEMMIPAGLNDNRLLGSRGVGLGGLGASALNNGIQQSPGIFRSSHHHSASDPSALRDPTTLAMLSNNMQAFAPGMFQPGMHSMPPPAIYPPQFYSQEMAMQQLVNSRMQEYAASYGMSALGHTSVSTPQSMETVNNGLASPGSSNGGTNVNSNGGPSANNRKLGLYKTELCRSWEEKGSCRYGTKCQFAHGEEELRRVARHPKYKTEICKTFWVSGSCPYGKRCCFIHTELSSVQAGANLTGSSENIAQPPSSSPSSNGKIHHRERSNSDTDTSTSVSFLTRISQQDNQSPTTTSPPTPSTATDPFSLSLPLTSRPPMGSLRVDTTNVEPNLSLKQNKSAYPTFNGILLGGGGGTSGSGLEFGGSGGGVGAGGLNENGRGLTGSVFNSTVGRFRHEAAPVTAGPDLGRHNLARAEIVGLPSHQRKGSASSITIAHHSRSGSDIDLSFSPSPPGSSGHSYSLSTSSDTTTSVATYTNTPSTLSPVQPIPTRLNGHGHVRTGSAGTLNWGSGFAGSSSASRNSSHHPLSTSVGSTWVGELAARVGNNEKTWV